MDLRRAKPSRNFMDRTGDGYSDHMDALMRVLYDAQSKEDKEWAVEQMDKLQKIARSQQLDLLSAYEYFGGGMPLTPGYNPEATQRRMIQRRFGTAR